MVQFNVNLEGKTVLVTGAAGFIGSNLVKRLFHDVKDIRVVGLDCITDYYDLCGKRLEGKQRGPVIVRYNDGSTRKVMVK